MIHLITILLVLSSMSYAEKIIVKTMEGTSLSLVRSSYPEAKIDRMFSLNDEELSLYYVFESKKYTIKNLKESNLFSVVEPSFEADVFATQIKEQDNSVSLFNDMMFTKQWGLYNQRQIFNFNLITGYYDQYVGKEGIDISWAQSIEKIESMLKKTPTVAVIDSGVDYLHDELEGQIYKNESECNVFGRPKNKDVKDVDGNGYRGDCLGWNFTGMYQQEGSSKIMFNDPDDDNQHGTHVAGIIAAKRSNNKGIVGVSDRIKVLPIKVTGRVDSDPRKRNLLRIKAPSERIAKGIEYAVKRGVDVINLSLGWPQTMDTQYMRAVINYAHKNGVIVVAASGNNGSQADILPCAYANVVCVGSINAKGEQSRFSNYGGNVDVLAPGENIISTIPHGFIALNENIDGYEILSGTSMAAPFVAAQFALLKSIYTEESNESIKTRVFSTTKSIHESDSMHGLIQLGDSVLKEKATQLVRPEFKGLTDVSFNAKNGEFKFFIPFKNYSFDLENFVLVAEVRSKDVKLKTNFRKVELLKENEITYLQVEGKITNRFTNSDKKICAMVVVKDEKKTYCHQVSFAKSIMTTKSNNLGVKNKLGVALINIKKNRDGSLYLDKDYLTTIKDVFSLNKNPSFYISRTMLDKKKKPTGVKRVYLIEQEQDFFNVDKSYDIKEAFRIDAVTRGDFNYDGEVDYLVTVIQKCELSSCIAYHYLNKDFKPLYKKKSTFMFYPKKMVINYKNLNYVKTKYRKSYIALPLFQEIGTLPQANQSLSAWGAKDYAFIPRLYSFKIKEGKKENVLELISRTSLSFFEEIAQKASGESQNQKAFGLFKARVKKKVAKLITIKKQRRKDYYENINESVFNVGDGLFAKTYMLKNIHSDYTIEKNNVDLSTDSMLANTIALDPKESSLSLFLEFTDTDKLNLIIDNAHKNFISVTKKKDIVSDYIAGYYLEDKVFSFVETVNDLILDVYDMKTKQKVQSSLPVKKFSFLPGAAMSSMFMPLVVNTKSDKAMAGIYYDSIRISTETIKVLTTFNDRLSSVVDLSFHVPKGKCIAKDPHEKSPGQYQMSFVCFNGKSVYFKFIPIEI